MYDVDLNVGAASRSRWPSLERRLVLDNCVRPSETVRSESGLALHSRGVTTNAGTDPDPDLSSNCQQSLADDKAKL